MCWYEGVMTITAVTNRNTVAVPLRVNSRFVFNFVAKAQPGLLACLPAFVSAPSAPSRTVGITAGDVLFKDEQ